MGADDKTGLYLFCCWSNVADWNGDNKLFRVEGRDGLGEEQLGPTFLELKLVNGTFCNFLRSTLTSLTVW